MIYSECLLHVKNCKWSDIFPYLQVNKLVYHSFMDVGRRHKTRVREKRFCYSIAQQEA